MADGSEIESGLLMEVTTAPNTLSQTAPVQIVSVTDGDATVPEDGQVAEDILQQAFVEAEDFVPSVEYAGVGKEQDTSVADEIVNNVIAEGSLVTTVADAVTDGQVYAGPEEYGVVGTQAEVESGDAGFVDGETNLVESNVNNTAVNVLEHTVPEPDGQTVVASTQPAQPAQTGNVSVAVIPATTNLGTSHNPIRIIQQGNQYTPVQQLTAEQLQQIMQVVQQQQLAKTTTAATGSSVLFNPQTNTRIVYRVIYPSELHKNSTAASQTAQSLGQPNNSLTPHQKRPYKKRSRDEEEDKLQEGGPELSKEEKEERKKHRPRTRSGRVSKPPKHMMKDYKHIHVLDWDEDYDDSDGGYSDYKCSDEEKRRNEEGVEGEKEGTYVYPGLGSTRPKNYKCETCEKAYIGQAGLSRHFRLYPSHGSIPEGELETEKNPDGSGRTNGSFGSLSEDSNTQDSIPGMETGSGAGTPSPVAKRGYIYSGRGRGRGRHLQELSHSRRKAKLKEIVRQCEDEDLMEVVLPRLAKVITLYEFLLMKVEKGYPSRPHADDIFLQFEALHKQVHKACQTYLTPLSKDAAPDNSTRSLQIENAQLAQALGLDVGHYEVKEMPVDETSTFHSKQTPEKIILTQKPLPVRRKIQETTPNQLQGNSFAKRPKTVSILPDNSPAKSASGSAISVHKSTPNVHFRVVSAASSSPAASLDTPHIIAVSAPHIGDLTNNTASAGSVHQALSNMNIMSNTKIVSVSNPNITTASTPRVVALSGYNQQIVTVASPNTSGSGIMATVGQPHAAVRPPESSVQTSSHVGGVDKSQEILSSQAATSTMITNNSEVIEAMDTDIASSVTSQTATPSVVNSSSSIAVNNVSAIIDRESNGESITVVVNGNVTNNTAVKQLQPLVQEALQTDVQNIRVVESLEEAQQIVLAQTQMNGVDPSSNMTTLAEVVHSESDFMEQTSVNGADVKREIVINPVEMKQEVGEEGQVVTAEQIDGQVVGQDQIVTHSNIYQTEDGILIIQNPDGTTFQLQGAEGIPLETVQALLAMEGQFEGGEQVQAELQQ